MLETAEAAADETGPEGFCEEEWEEVDPPERVREMRRRWASALLLEDDLTGATFSRSLPLPLLPLPLLLLPAAKARSFQAPSLRLLTCAPQLTLLPLSPPSSFSFSFPFLYFVDTSSPPAPTVTDVSLVSRFTTTGSNLGTLTPSLTNLGCNIRCPFAFTHRLFVPPNTPTTSTTTSVSLTTSRTVVG
jgi:hypothetical protein